MGTCISRPKKVDRRKNPQNLYLQHPQSSNCEAIPNDSQVMITTNNSHNNVIPFPYFQPKWTINKNKQRIKSIDMSKIISKSGNNKDWINNYLNWRYYSYSQIQVKKLFTTKPYFIEQIENKQWVKVPTLQGLLFSSYQTSKIKLCPQFDFLDASLNFNNQLQQDSVLMANQANTPAYHIFQNHNNEIIIDLLAESERVKILFNALKDCKKTNLTKNCLFNGILFRSQNKNINNPQNKRHVNMKFNDVMEIFDEKIQGIQFTDQIICYINPLLRQGLKNQGKSIRKLNYSTYLQLKCELQCQNLDIVQLFNPDLIMTSSKCQPICAYILLFCLKVVMFNNQALKQIPLLFLNQFIKMVSQQKNILSKVFNVMAFCYALILPHYCDLSKIYDPELVRNCCRNVLQISAVNSHILVDAYLIQFSVEIDQKITPIRQNPLIQPSQPLKYRGLITLQLNKRLINSLKTQMDRHILLLLKQLSSQVLQPKQALITNLKKIIQEWQQQSLKIISIILEIKTLTKMSRLKSLMDLAKDYYSPNMFIIFQYLLGIKIFMFVAIAQIAVDILVISPTLLARDASMIRNIKKDWNQIIQDFMSNTAFNYCSGELSITILTLDALVKMLDLNQNIQQTKQNLKKCMEIWFRIYRDPRAKYKPFLPNSWIVYIIDVLIKVKIKNLTDNYSTQSIFYLQNILECFYANGDVLEFGNPSHIQWIFANIPIRNISGIFYNKIDLIAAPSPDDKSGFLMRTGSSLIQSPGDLSSKSNFSQTISNKNSVVSRNRRIRYGNIQIPQFSQCKALRNGVYAWGKGINCIPLIYPFAKNLDVLKISCGNYHVVLATSIGVFGWGENASGQLGQPSKQPIRTIKMILPKIIINSDFVSLSCGNQHTAILFKYQTLIMFGQSQCGIISGNGHKFDYVSCGGLHTLGIKNGRVYSWGRGEGGQLGHKTSQLKTKVKEQSTDFYLDQPKMIQNLPLIVKSVCGDAHSILLTQQGDVYVFGFSYQGQLGLGITGDNDLFQIFQPVKLNFNVKNKNIKIVDIFAGSTFTFFKTSQGQIYSCGLNDCNQLGMQQMMKVFHKKKYLGQQKKTNQRKLGQAQFSRPNKIQIFNSQTKVKEIFCGENHCLASVEYMSKNKMVMGWGLNKQLQISSEFPHDSIKPRTIDNIYDFNFESLCCGSNCSYGYIRHQNRLTLHQLQQNIQILIKNNLKYTKAPFIDGKEKTIVRG